MDLFEAIERRHSYRKAFTDDPVPREDLVEIVRAGIRAPSAKNEQVATFVIVDDPQLLKQIAEVVKRPVCDTARAMIACVEDPRPVIGEVSFSVEDCSAAVPRWDTPRFGSTACCAVRRKPSESANYWACPRERKSACSCPSVYLPKSSGRKKSFRSRSGRGLIGMVGSR